MMGTNKLYMQL